MVTTLGGEIRHNVLVYLMKQNEFQKGSAEEPKIILFLYSSDYYSEEDREGFINVSRKTKVIDYWAGGFWNHLSKCGPFLTCHHKTLMDFKISCFKIVCH